MKERNNIQPEQWNLPPAWCSRICRNAMNEVCVEHCAIKRDCSFFEEKQNLKLSDMPRFPIQESANMTKEEKFTSVTIYLAKVVDHLQGNDDEQHYLNSSQNAPIKMIARNKAITDVTSILPDLQKVVVGVQADEATYSTTDPAFDSESLRSKSDE